MPKLYVGDRLFKATELSEISAGGRGLKWFWEDPENATSGDGSDDNDHIVVDDVTHAPLVECPGGDALAVARRLATTLEGVWLPSSESDTLARVFCVTSKDIAEINVDSKNQEKNDGKFDDETESALTTVCLSALGVKPEVRRYSTLTKWTDRPHGFCYSACLEEDDEEEDPDRTKVKEATKILMEANVSKNKFELNFTDDLVCAPVLYGGIVGGTAIVGILSMRVWT